jgi:hypothetical protein
VLPRLLPADEIDMDDETKHDIVHDFFKQADEIDMDGDTKHETVHVLLTS